MPTLTEKAGTGLNSISSPRSNDLTKGIIWKQLLKFSAPLVLSSFLQSFYGIADMIIAGHFIGPNGLSAANNSSSIMTFVTFVILGLCTGGGVLIGQYFGAGDRAKCKHAVTTLFTFTMVFGALLSILLMAAAKPLLVSIRAPVLEDATSYLRICASGSIFIAGYNAANAAMRSVGNSRAPLICVLVSCLLNVVLDIVFTGFLGMGVDGLALATVFSQGASFVLALCIVLRDRELYGLKLTKLYIRIDELKTMLKLGIPVSIQLTVAHISWFAALYLLNGYDVFVSAGNGVSMKIRDFCLLLIFSMANGATAMIAQNIGAKEYERVRKVMFCAMRISLCVAISLIAAVEALAPQLVSIFTSEANTAAAAVRNLRIEILSQVIYAVLLMYHALGLGSGHTMYVLFSSFVNSLLVRIPLIFLLNHYVGLDGIYIGLMIAPLSSIPVGIWYERSNRWRKHRL